MRFGLTSLVLDAFEAGALEGAPRFADKDPDAFKDASPEATRRVEVDGVERDLTALEIQKWYLDRIRRFLDASNVVHLEARELVQRWKATPHALDRCQDLLVGKLDWITMLEAMAGLTGWDGANRAWEYNWVGPGGLAQFDEVSDVERVVTEAEVETATFEPPADA